MTTAARMLRRVAGPVVVAAWLVLFGMGLTMNSQPFRDQLASGVFTVNDIIMTMLLYTVTNAALLCLLSGVAGSIAHVALGKLENADEPPPLGKIVLTGVVRGFAIYLLYVSGVYIGASDAFGSTTADQYARVVATTSLLSFVAGYSPPVFNKLIGVVQQAAEDEVKTFSKKG